MKIEWPKLIFFVFLIGAWLFVLIWFMEKGMEEKEKRENERLREVYSPMSDSPEIQKAYDEVR